MRWALDGGALHLYDIGEDEGELASGLAEAQAHARGAGAAVLFAEIFDGDACRAALERFGFCLDAQEPDVRDRQLTTRLSFVKVL